MLVLILIKGSIYLEKQIFYSWNQFIKMANYCIWLESAYVCVIRWEINQNYWNISGFCSFIICNTVANQARTIGLSI